MMNVQRKENDDGKKLGNYFLKKEINEMFEDSWKSRCIFDDSGILMIDYGENRGIQYNPGTIAQYIIYAHEKHIRNSDGKWGDVAVKHADWLIEHAETKNNCCVWRYDFVWAAPGYFCEKGWISGLAQGMCISALVRAFQISGDKRYLNVSRDALQIYSIPLEKGGILRYSKHGNAWYEEYATDKSPQVLNGMMFAIIGAHEFHLASGDQEAKKLADIGVKTLGSELKYFDLDLFFFKWSRYDNKFLIMSREYHSIHILQLEYLAKYYDEEIFRHYIVKWNKSLSEFDSGKMFKIVNYFYSKYLKFLNFLERHDYFDG
jgi:hypothetical protein